MTSALANCLKGEYEEALFGTRLEICRNEKKAIRYAALYTCPM